MCNDQKVISHALACIADYSCRDGRVTRGRLFFFSPAIQGLGWTRGFKAMYVVDLSGDIGGKHH